MSRAALPLQKVAASATAGRRDEGALRLIPREAEPVPRTIRRAELLSALSFALDMTEGQPAGHCIRCCWIGIHIGRELGMAEADQTALYYTLLLKDLGCSSNAARICELYLTDDLTFKGDFKRVGDSLPQVLRFILAHTGLKAGLAERFQAMLNIVQNGGELARDLIETRCQRGAEIARQMRFSEAVAAGIRDLDEHWDGTGKARGLRGADISLFARIALLAQVIDVFQVSGGTERALREVRQRSGTWFDPRVVTALEAVARRPGFWETLRSEDIEDAIFAHEPALRSDLVDDEYLDDIAIAFAKVVDAKSPFTHGHSERVTLFTDLIAKELDLSSEQRRWLKRAALLHDIGKLGVSNQILDKPGKLDEAEWEAMRRHSELSETILERIEAFRDLARVAGAHHERLDGKGYPKGLAGEQICFETRIITTADIFDALTADRPYRGPIPIPQALSMMSEMVGSALDPDCFAALERAAAKLESPPS
jgi:HD-GYP domain-containing protein (c-di-GMP phosphodiesterase class II)